MERSTRQRRTMGSRKRQGGGETVEFAVTLIFFFLVFLLIGDMAIAMYDKGAITNAARYAARQGSLYWINPDDFDKDEPNNATLIQQLKESMVSTAVNYWAKTIVNPGHDSITIGLSLTGPNVAESGGVWTGVAGGEVTVNLSYSHQFLLLPLILPVKMLDRYWTVVEPWTMQASAGHDMEARF